MEKKNNCFVPQVDFSQQTPEMLIGGAETKSGIEKTFAPAEKSCSDFAQNTCTHD